MVSPDQSHIKRSSLLRRVMFELSERRKSLIMESGGSRKVYSSMSLDGLRIQFENAKDRLEQS